MTHDLCRVREATVLDVDLIAPLFDAYRQFYGQAPDLHGSGAFLRRRIQHGESRILVAESLHPSGHVLGFAQVYPSFSSVRRVPIWILNDLFVVPTARRSGVGATLLGATAALAKALRIASITLATGRANGAAQALYAKCGYSRDEDFYTYVLDV
ncbi:MAG TPA: GNAT family N-acetyltransferase [Gemmatimonadaceae bacterium]